MHLQMCFYYLIRDPLLEQLDLLISGSYVIGYQVRGSTLASNVALRTAF